jgi:hypothetical protein
MGRTGIDLFLDWENGIWVAGTGIWPLGMGNEVLKNGIGIEVMRVDSQFLSAFFKEFSLGGGGQNRKKGRTKNMSRRGLANARV